MTLEWLRPRKPLGLMSLRYVRLTTSKYGMKLSTKLRLRLLLYLGRQRIFITLKPFVPPPSAVPRQTPLPKWLIQRRVASRRSLPPLATLQKWSTSLGVNEKEAEVTKGVAPDATKPSTVPKILLKIKGHPGWRLFWQLFHFLPKVILKAQTKDPQRLQSSSPRPCPKEKL